MYTFKQYITETIVNEILPIQKKKVEVFMGRFQPVHKGHLAVIKKMKNPIVVLVKGAKSSQDKTRNPFDEKYQTKLLKKLGNVKVIIAPTGYLPMVFNELRKSGFEPTAMYAGDDRFRSYQAQLDGLKLDKEKAFSIKWKKTPRVASATEVRATIANDDEKAFKKVMPKQLHGEFETMKKKMGVK